MTTFIAYERAHASVILAEKGPNDRVIACGLGTEYALEAAGVPCISGRGLRRVSTPERIDLAGSLARSLIGERVFFQYRDVSLGKIFATPLHFYLATLLFALDSVAAILEEPCDSVAVCAPTEVARRGGTLSTQSAHVFSDAVALVCAARGVPWRVVGPADAPATRIFAFKRRIFGWGMKILNAIVSIVPPKPIRILVSDNWKNVGSLFSEFTDAEVTLIDRTEVFTAGILGIFRNRMRFVAFDDFDSREGSRVASEVSKHFTDAWNKISTHDTALHSAEFRGYNLSPILKNVLDYLFKTGGELGVRDIERMHRMLTMYRPHVIMVRASMYSAQTHFALLCRVGETLGIPSVELQHGLLCFGEGSFYNYPGATYIAEYGKAVRIELEKNGYDRSRLLDIGSPRFDVYNKLQWNGAASSDMLCIAPNITPGFVTDSYDVEDYFRGVAGACRELGLDAVIKLRKPHPQESVIREIIARSFAGVPHKISQEPLTELFQGVCMVVSAHSTVLLESMLAGVPTVYFTAQLPIYKVYGQATETATAVQFRAYAAADTTAELVEAIRRKEPPDRRFIDEWYAFDGRSAQRLADAVKRLVEG